MPYCYNCGEELYLITPILSTKNCICENCKTETSVIVVGKVTDEELDRAYQDLQTNYYQNMGIGSSFRKTVFKMQENNTYKSIKLKNPADRNEERFAGIYQ